LHFDLVSGILFLIQKRRGRSPKDSFLVLGSWPKAFRIVFTFGVVLHFLLPLILFLLPAAWAAILKAAVGWSFFDSYEYVICNIATMPPMVNLVPANTGGQIADILVSVIIFALTAAVLGVAASTGIVTELCELIPKGHHGIILTMSMIPVALLLLTFVLALFVTHMEGWDLWTSYLFMTSILCGLGDPLTPVVPTTDKANFFILLCSILELSIGGAIIGIVASHPKVLDFIAYIEGNNLEIEIAKSGEGDSNKLDSLTEESKRDKQEISDLKARVQMLQSRLTEAGLN